jgi:hypothetical protein
MNKILIFETSIVELLAKDSNFALFTMFLKAILIYKDFK